MQTDNHSRCQCVEISVGAVAKGRDCDDLEFMRGRRERITYKIDKPDQKWSKKDCIGNKAMTMVLIAMFSKPRWVYSLTIYRYASLVTNWPLDPPNGSKPGSRDWWWSRASKGARGWWPSKVVRIHARLKDEEPLHPQGLALAIWISNVLVGDMSWDLNLNLESSGKSCVSSGWSTMVI